MLSTVLATSFPGQKGFPWEVGEAWLYQSVEKEKEESEMPIQGLKNELSMPAATKKRIVL